MALRCLGVELKVNLLTHTPNPERVCAAAALSSYWFKGASETLEVLSQEEIEDILKRVISYGHISVIEHASFTFSLEGVSRALTHQLVRHRIASYTQQSQRYVKVEDLDSFVLPKSVKENKNAFRIFKEIIKEIHKSYKELIEIGIPKEDARFLLPNATKTNIVLTMNARELLHFFQLRCCNRAQWEIREVSWRMVSQVREKAPLIFKDAGPLCVKRGECPEGDLACEVWKRIKTEERERRKEIMKRYFFVRYLKNLKP